MSLKNKLLSGRDLFPIVLKAAFLLVLLSMAAWNLLQVQDFVQDITYRKVLPNRRFSPVERGGDITEGGDFPPYLRFLLETIPPDATVVIPSGNWRFNLNSPGLMQYRLFPRRIVRCPDSEWEACLSSLPESETYILIQPGFPARELIPEGKSLVTYSDELQVLAP